ncbi:MAG: TolC family protein [Flavobacteriales bacterium]|nr:TolC family protein [Flavobacteriales bacterium]
MKQITMWYRSTISLGLLFLGIAASNAQVLTIEQAVEFVLQSNFEGKQGARDLEIATNSATAGNAGLHPAVQLNTGANYSNNNTELVFAGNIPRTNVKGAVSTSLNASVGASYTVFSGFANLRRFELLQNSRNLSEEQLQLTLENAVITTLGLYLDLVKLSDDRINLQANLNLSAERIKQIRKAKGLGTATTLDLMAAEVDYNQDSSTLLNLENQIGAVKRQINFLMGRSIATPFEVENSLGKLPEFNLAQVLEKARNNSTQLILADLRSKSSELGESIASAAMMPQIVLNSSFGTVNSQNAAGIILEQNNLGFNGGVSVSLPIYNGGKIRTAVENARVEIEKSAINKAQIQLSVEKDVYDQWFNLEHFKKLNQLELQNLRTAQLRMEQASSRYALGQIGSLDYREAQLALLAVQSRANAANIQAHKAAYQLYRLTGALFSP